MGALDEQNRPFSLQQLKSHLANQKRISFPLLSSLLEQFSKIISMEPNLLELTDPVVIIGDLHGQYPDLLKVLSLCPELETNPNYKLLFLGDYVDRGPNGCEVFILLMAYKIRFPNQVFMLRGNHESKQMAMCFGFQVEAIEKYGRLYQEKFYDVFNSLSLACIVNGKYFCVHGGLSTYLQTPSDIQKINRFKEIPLQGLFCDLMWADPFESAHGNLGKLVTKNLERNCSYIFGKELTEKFLSSNQLLCLIRAHEVELQGYRKYNWGEDGNISFIYTIFSAPNYCGTYRNKGAILTINNDQFTIRQFKQEKIGRQLPSGLNAISFLLPRISLALREVLVTLARAQINQISEQQRKLNGTTNRETLPIAKGEISKQFSDEALLFGYLRAMGCSVQRLEPEFPPPVSSGNEQQQIDRAFRMSLEYYSQSEKRPLAIPKGDITYLASSELLEHLK